MPPHGACLGQHRESNRARGSRDGVGKLFLDARRQAGARPRARLPAGRSALHGPSGRRARLQLLDHALRARSGRPRQENSRQRLPHGDRRCLGRRIRRPRSGSVAADSGSDPHEAGDGARLGMGAHGRSADALGAGVRTPEAGLHGSIGGGAAPGSVHPDPPVRDHTPGGEKLDAVFPRSVHEGPAARRSRGNRLLFAAQRLLHRAHRPDVHGRARAADRLRERRESAHRPRLHAAKGNRRSPVARRVARAAGHAAARREPPAVVHRRRRRPCHGGGADAQSARARAVAGPAAPDQRAARRAHPRLHVSA